ncbi:MAG TPA: ATP-dependent DNA helicase RecQ [Pirellulales bacterium]|jgi:ATP-dependent DNA helicase RecQ|nr:ATP-dependent DNA helicase RecQ [Pirellulales bacterium]
MADELLDLLHRNFGFDHFLAGQREVIAYLLAKNSAAAVFPTGGGKSLCYQLPALMLEGVTLVVSPLIALMKDQIDALTRRGIAAARLDSTLSADQYREVMLRVRDGAVRLLYVAPERFQNERFRRSIEGMRVALFAVDEAHCISEWGHNFRPDYLKLVEFARRCHAERLLALTATATPQVLDDICRSFEIEPRCAIRNSCYRPNLTILTTPVEFPARDALLIERLRQRPAGPTIVYVTLQRTAETVAAQLAAAGVGADAYHAGMEDHQRAEVQERFMRSKAGIVVATIAFGMGIDKSDIRYVYHYNLPKSLENYSQEIGRAGRDGQPAICEMLVCVDDLNQLENFAYGDTPTRSAVDRLVENVFSQGPQFDVSYHDLATQCDIRVLVIRTLLTYLELDGYLSGGTPFYSTYKFRPLQPSSHIFSQFDGERRQFLERLFREVKKGKTWFQIDVDGASRSLGAPRDRIVRALDYLNEQGWLELQAAGTRNRFQRLKTPADPDALAEKLHARTVDREQQEIARLGQVLELTRQQGCQIGSLCGHFGETRAEPCGHCTRCLAAGAPSEPLPRGWLPIDPAIVDRALTARAEHPELLSDPVIATRWLCGVTSPALSRAKLTSHPLFGALEHQPLAAVRARLEKALESQSR